VLATKDKPIGVKYSNLLPIGGATDAYGNGVASRDGDLFIPVDATLPGGALPQNRAEIHLHGGLTPWISDGTPHQWTLPVGDPAVYQKGASFRNVPDMPEPGQGSGTLYWTNDQSARLMAY